MITRIDGFHIIKHFEGKYKFPYLCPSGFVTCGIGHIVKDPDTKKPLKGALGLQEAIKMYPNGVSDELMYEWLKKDIITSERLANDNLKVVLTQYQFDALVSHTFNCGVSETLYKLINTLPLDDPKIKIWWTTKYITGQGKQLPGLIKRRRIEYELFNTGILDLK